ncbi:CCA tRNA nucleotidyltransferase [Kaistia dalseonensis]|uniref:tRNA nucleotidyltransferase/poly(A) polymerase n=1 Tax=Kaistia dalseonensis TaxID=410840 RepID=A0ABU0H659_9HYPH|nr:CCA tRNA nucleotidyltransferase [Kaistia dalseonensis]MCX5495208.1 CCA tRNA nucleotidyltransferase [Kaistia dalseonensis]MDQ0437793.1 tRNA nucleotidyltransferase/poly(A) polymerase [Kaistia dalseonensis]
MVPPLRDAPFLTDPLVRHVLSLLSQDGDEARVVGGAVRNALLGLPVADVDIATTMLPEAVMAQAIAAGLKAVPTGIEHGTVTVIGQHRAVEVTTLREDIETDGRRAVVRFGRDWAADAARRDFTINAISVDLDGILHDTVGGLDDLAARRVRFIGSAETRIAEDRLRVLRFFRFHAAYGTGKPDAEGLSAAIRARQDLGELSAERIGQEMRKLVVAAGAVETVAIMQESGILPLITASVADLAAFAHLTDFEDGPPIPALRFATLFARVGEDVDRIALRLRLSNGERRRMRAALEAATALPSRNTISDHALLYAIGREAFFDGLALASARRMIPTEEAATRKRAASAWAIPTFPLAGRDVVESGIDRGPLVGLILRHLERGWIEEDFAPDAEELRRRLQGMIAAAQQQQQQQ